MKREMVNVVTFDHDGVQVAAPVNAVVVGPLAVHRELANDYNRWAVSHVRTGYRVRGGIKSKARALRVAEALQFLDWNFRSARTRKITKRFGQRVNWVIDCTV